MRSKARSCLLPAPARRSAPALLLAPALLVAAGWLVPAAATPGTDPTEPVPVLLVARDAHEALADEAEALADQRVDVLAQLTQQADEQERLAVERAAAELALSFAQDLQGQPHVLPLTPIVRTAHFGSTGGHWSSVHSGEDFAAPAGTPLRAISAGEITSVGDAGAYGLRTIITLPNGTELWYCHQSVAKVHPGERVRAGQVLGAVGSTGNTTGPHLHLEVRPPGQGPIDPVAWLRGLGLKL